MVNFASFCRTEQRAFSKMCEISLQKNSSLLTPETRDYRGRQRGQTLSPRRLIHTDLAHIRLMTCCKPNWDNRAGSTGIFKSLQK